MKVRIEYIETSRRVVTVEADSVAEVRQKWDDRDEEMIDAVTDDNYEIDGGIDWDSAEFEEVP